METRPFSRAWTAAEIFSAVIAFGLAALSAAVDVVGEYFVNTSYFFALRWW